MRNVNNKYLINYEINQEENFTEYVVHNCEDNKKYILCILKKNFTYEKTRQYLLRNFKTLRSLNFKNVVNLLQIEIIYKIDGIKLDNPRYGYLLEFVKSKGDTQSYLQSCSTSEKLDIFMEFAAAVNTLNMNGYIFHDISIKDMILICGEDGKITVKIKNLLQREINKFTIINASTFGPSYLENRDMNEEGAYSNENMSEIVNIFNKIFTNKELKNELKSLKDIKHAFNPVKTISKFYRIRYFISYINEKTQKNYKLFFEEALNKINDDIDLVGLDEEIKFVEKTYNRILENKEKYKIIQITGDRGSGKTSLLNEIEYMLKKKYFAAVMYFKNYGDKYTKTQLYDKYEKDISNYLDKSLAERYGIYLKKFLELITCADSSSIESSQAMQLMNRIANLLREYTVSRPLVLLIDDLHKNDTIFIRFFRYLSFWGNNIENIMIIFSYNENECNQEFLNEVNEIKKSDKYEAYKISYLNQYDTIKIIQSMLKTNDRLIKLSNRIYSETLGNPQYIKAVINELYADKDLYFNNEKGVWEYNISHKRTLIPKQLEEKLEDCLSELDKEEIDILKKLSIFETPLSEMIILKDILKDSSEIERYKRLKDRQYFIDKISDQGILVGFSNNILRNILYLKLSDEEKFNLHNNACEFFEREVQESNYYMEEFISHLRKSNESEKFLYYIRKYAVSLQGSGYFDKSINYFNECLEYCDEREKVSICIIIAKEYEKISSHDNSYKYFNEAKKIIERENFDIKIKSYVLLEMVVIKINMFPLNNDGIVKKLAEIRKLLDTTYYPVGEAYYYYAMALDCRLINNRQGIVENAKKALEICERNNIKSDIYGWLLVTLSKMYTKYMDLEYVEDGIEKAIEVFNNNNNLNGIVLSELMHINILREKGENFNKIFEKYNEIYKLCIQNKSYKKQVLILNSIADLFLWKGDYENAEKYLLKALTIQKEEGISYYSINICNTLSMLYIKWGKIQSAAKYYYLFLQMHGDMTSLEDDFIYKNLLSSEYNEMICNYKEAYESFNNVFNLISQCKGQESRVALCRYYEFKLYSCINESMIKDIYSKLEHEMEEINYEEAVRIKVRSVKRILDLGYFDLAKELFYKIDKRLEDYDTQGLYSYLELYFKDRRYYNYLINKAIRISNFMNNECIKADLMYIVGVKYSELGCDSLSVNYYSESIYLHNKIIKSLPSEDGIIYANNSSSFLKCRMKLIEYLKKSINTDMDFLDISSIDSSEILNKVIDELNAKNILKNKMAYSLIQNIYEKCYYNDVSDIYKVFENFSSNIEDNLEDLLKYMARITLADKGVIIAENNEGKNSVLCSYRISGDNEISKYLLWKFDGDEEIVTLENNNNSTPQLSDITLKNGIKACLYMKLRNIDMYSSSSTSVNAKLILIAENAINYINSDTQKIIEKFKPFLIFLLEKYNLTILSTLDKLTGAYNRKYFEEALVSLIDNSRYEKKSFGVIMFDIDDFKGVNDKYGHQTGDEVLVKLTKEVKRCITKKDIIGRYGGEEFIVLLPDTDESKALSIAEKIRINVENAKILGEKRPVTISVGIAMNEYSLNQEEIVQRADEALYKSKYDGKNRCTLWKKKYVVSNSKVNSDELIGILSGNITKDYNLFSTLKDISGLVKVKDSNENRIYKFMSKIMQIIECDTVTIFIVENENIINTFSKVRAKEGFVIAERFNFDSVYKCISKKKGFCLVDWANIDNHNIHGIPDWKSLCMCPVVYEDNVVAVVYLSISVNNKEFGTADLNLLNCFADVALPIFK